MASQYLRPNDNIFCCHDPSSASGGKEAGDGSVAKSLVIVVGVTLGGIGMLGLLFDGGGAVFVGGVGVGRG